MSGIVHIIGAGLAGLSAAVRLASQGRSVVVHEATAVAGGYRVSGTWDFASGCRNANWMGAHCHVVEADGSLRLNHLGRPAIRTLLFPADPAALLRRPSRHLYKID